MNKRTKGRKTGWGKERKKEEEIERKEKGRKAFKTKKKEER